ncbi:MAG: sulfatase-like hydrolase/transferase [Longimicrobiales bacterium]
MRRRKLRVPRLRRTSLAAAAWLPVLVIAGCGDDAPGSRVLTSDMPLHLEDHLEAATIEGSEVPANSLQPVEWRFDQPQSDWRATPQWPSTVDAATLTRTTEGLRVTLTEGTDTRSLIPGWTGTLVAGIHVDLPDWNRGDWADVVIRARADSASSVTGFGLRFNLRDGRPTTTDFQSPYQFGGQNSPIVRDGSIQTYRLRADWSSTTWNSTGAPPRAGAGRPWQGPWRQLALWFWTDGKPGSIDLLSVTVVPKRAAYADSLAGRREIDRGGVLHPALFTHAPSALQWRVRVPDGGRLGLALTTLEDRAPVSFSVVVTASRDTTVFHELVTDETSWHPHSIDLSAFAGQTVDLSLRTESESAGAIGFWASPILSGDAGAHAARRRPPNVILYVIDGAGADLMSLYGYNRPTTPNLERLSAEGVVFERAHSNSAWTKPSTASFMTSLHHSALGGFRSYGDRIPEAAPIMAERFHDAGYQTASFTFHPNAGRGSALNRGVDRFQDSHRPGQDHNESSRFLQAEFWSWREAYPGSPYWAHFQVTDVHEPQVPVPPYRGMFVSAAQSDRFNDWKEQIERAGGWNRAARGEMSLSAHYRETMEQLGIDRIEFYDTQRGLYDETMAYTDHQLGRFVEHLKGRGEWENAILIVTADHGHPAGSHTRFGRELFEPLPPDTEGAFFDSYRTRVPLVFIAPGRLPEGVRIREAVSLIDLLPTVLDLAGLPPLERTQGRSLVPLMRGDANWETRPVILEQVERDVLTDELTGHIEMIDGRWGASLEIWPERGPREPPVQPSRWEAKARLHVDGQPRLLLYDLWEDPFTRANVNDRYPELVEKYMRLLEEQWQAHLAMAALYEPAGSVELSAEQLETLRALGYIR